MPESKTWNSLKELNNQALDSLICLTLSRVVESLAAEKLNSSFFLQCKYHLEASSGGNI
jgi:hypothetical protein